jgi:hypothetical protein
VCVVCWGIVGVHGDLALLLLFLLLFFFLFLVGVAILEYSYAIAHLRIILSGLHIFTQLISKAAHFLTYLMQFVEDPSSQVCIFVQD